MPAESNDGKKSRAFYTAAYRNDAHRAFLYAEAYRVLSRTHSAFWPSEEAITVYALDKRFRVTVTISPADATGLDLAKKLDTGEKVQVEAPSLCPAEQDALGVATATPQTAQRLANLAGRKLNSRFRAAITELCRKGLMIRTPDGYKLA